MAKIEPEVGRIVWYRAAAIEIGEHGLTLSANKPLAAQIAAVNEDGTINLRVVDARGGGHARQDVALVQEGDDAPEGSAYAEWMPYQKGQAAKTEELEKQVVAPAT